MSASARATAPRITPPVLSGWVIRHQEQAARRWVMGVVLLQIGCQLALITPGLGAGRVVFRVAAFGASLLALALVRGAVARHPSRPWLLGALALVGLQFFSPTTNSPLAGLASIALSVAIAAPIFWVPRLRLTPRLLGQTLFILWAFQTASASVGVLQALYPGRFAPQLAEMYQGLYSDALKIDLADGSTIYRPPGLTDAPGGAAPAGLMAYLLGLGFLTNSRSITLRVFVAGGMAAGLFCMVLCQVRVTVVLAGIMTVGYAGILLVRGRISEFLGLAALLPFVIAGGAGYALSVGGESTAKRLQTLVEDDPNAVYYSNRGHFLEYTFDKGMEDYPFGAGLGRWGMTMSYFGNRDNPDAPPLWVEIQWTAWLYDGGAPLMVAYCGAILAACFATLRIATRSRDRRVAGWAATLTAYNLGVGAVTFSYVPFIGQMGLEFWLLNGAVFAAARVADSVRARPDS